MAIQTIQVGNIKVANDQPFVLFGGMKRTGIAGYGDAGG